MKVTQDYKMVVILDEELPVGLLSNTAAILALTIGKEVQDLVGTALTDASGDVHKGLTKIPLPILKTTGENLKQLREKSKSLENLFMVDVTDAAQTTTNYDDYEQKLKNTKLDELKLLGIALAGNKKDVQSLSGNLGLLR